MLAGWATCQGSNPPEDEGPLAESPFEPDEKPLEPEEKPLEPIDPEEAEVEYAYRIMPTTMRINEVYIQVRLDEIQINVPHLLTEFVFLS